MRLKLFPKFLLVLILLSVIPVAIAGYIVSRITTDSLQFEVQRYHTHIASSLAERIDERLSTLRVQLSVVKLAMQNPDETWESRQKLLSALIDSSNGLGIVSVVGENDMELLKAWDPTWAPEVEANPVLLSHTSIPLYQNFKKSGVREADVIKDGNNIFANIYMPIESKTGRKAIFVKAVLNDSFALVDKAAIGQTGFAYYVGRTGELLSSPKFLKNLPTKVIKTALSGSEGAIEFADEDGQAWVGAFSPLKKLGGAIITQQYRDEAYAESLHGKRIAIGIVGITIFIVILAALLLTRSLVKPLLTITRVAQTVDLSTGQFPQPIRINTRDEISELAQTFNNMLDKLRGYADLQVEKLIIEQKKTEAIIFSIEDGIIMTDYQGKIQLISRTARTIFSIPESEPVLGHPLWQFLPNAELKSAFMDVLTKPEEKKHVEIKLPRDTKDSYYNLSSEQVRTPSKGETLGVVTVIHDVTLEKELDSMKEEFLHSITHDLRNPMTAIRGFIRLFQTGQAGPINEIQKKMLDTMDKASLRLITMINDILDLARLESNRMNIHLEACQIEDIPRRVIELFQAQTKNAAIELKTDLPTAPMKPLYVDPNLIERVFTNLIGNSTKFTPEGGSITVKIENFDDHVRCAVIDTGEGIPKTHLEKVFDKFRQVEGHYKGGAGLGLTICKHIVEAHLGKIWVESEFGHGAQFIFTIPKNLEKTLEEKKAA